jgi:hypothetical protein
MRAAFETLDNHDHFSRKEFYVVAVFLAVVLAVELLALRKARQDNFTNVWQEFLLRQDP